MDYGIYGVKWLLVNKMKDVLLPFFSDIKDIEYRMYVKLDDDGFYTEHVEEFIVLEWEGGGCSYANNNCNSLSATARNVTRMLDGGVYENVDIYKKIMSDEKNWRRRA